MGRRRIGLILVAVVAVGTACAGGDEGTGDAGISLDEPIGASERTVSAGGGAGADAVAKSAFAAMTVPRSDLDAATQEVVDLATAPDTGGFLVSSVFDSEEGHGAARVLVKVPSPVFEDVVDKLGDIGKISRQELVGEDLSPELLRARDAVRRARDRTAALIAQLQSADDRAARFRLRQRIQTTRSELWATRREASELGSELFFSQVDVSLSASAPPLPPEKPVVERALATAKGITLGVASATILLAGVAVPLLLMLLLLFLLGGPLVRRLKPRLRGWPA